jgi:YCII-related domain-containing protein
MPDYLFLMHDDATEDGDWGPYLQMLERAGKLQGGSAIGSGLCVRKAGRPPPITGHLAGFIRVEAGNLAEAQALLAGNPVFENGGTVEIRELPKTD